MDIDITKWYVRIFFWSLGIWDKFWEDWNTGPQYTKGTNLCHAIRVTFVWMPLVLMLHVALILTALFVLIFLPLHYFEWTLYLPIIKVAGLIGIALVIIILAAVLLTKLIDMIEERKKRSPEKEEKSNDPSIWKIMGIWLADKDKRICRILTFHAPSEETKNA